MAQKRRKRRKNPVRAWKRIKSAVCVILVSACLLLCGFGGVDYYENDNIDRTLQLLTQIDETAENIPGMAKELFAKAEEGIRKLSGDQDTGHGQSSMNQIPEYSGEPYVVINDNVPEFGEEERKADAYEYYSELDFLGRCGMAEAMITAEIMPTEERGKIGMVKPSGWHTVKYDNIDGKYLYNRCHLIAFELAGENANEQNLITGTRYMNVNGMLPWENMVTQYVRRTNDKVLYRVTPVFEGDDLVAKGVHMEGESIGSDEIQFNIFVFDVQPGIGIDYANGDSWQE